VACPESPRPESQLSQHSWEERPPKPSKKKNQQNGGSTTNLSHTQLDATSQNGIDKTASSSQPSAAAERKDKTSPPPPPSLGPNFVKENFVGVGVRRTKCLECESSTFKKEEFTNIDIPVQCDEDEEDSAYNFFINRILASETLRDGNKYWCSECSRLNEAQLTVSYEVLPTVLVLQLKRFTTTASRAYVSKLTDYIPTPLVLDCFCQKCRDGAGPPLHRYRLYSVILHLGASLASGHYIACVRAADINLDFFQCSRPGLSDTATRNKHTKHRGIFKMFSSKSSSAAPPEPAYGVTNPVCGSISCCGLKMNPNLVSDEQRPASSSSSSTGVANGHSAEGSNGSSPRYSPGGGRPDSTGPASGDQDDIWLECDDEQISVITRYRFVH
jgi:Ubiquitin carboxyl-terminal hydrolase